MNVDNDKSQFRLTHSATMAALEDNDAWTL